MTHFTITKEIEDERVHDLLVSALEGGSNYWYMLEERIDPPMPYQFTTALWSKEREKNPAWIHTEEIPFNEGGALIFSVISEERDTEKAKAEEAKRYRLDRDAMQKGIELMAEHSPAHFGDFIKENDDAVTGDIFLQYCLFGEIIYG